MVVICISSVSIFGGRVQIETGAAGIGNGAVPAVRRLRANLARSAGRRKRKSPAGTNPVGQNNFLFHEIHFHLKGRNLPMLKHSFF